MPVYISSSCLTGHRDIFEVLDTYAEAGLRNIELGSSHNFTDNLSPARFKRYGFNFICHHYFPPPRDPFIINLASRNKAILKKSREQIKRSIDFCASLGIGLFSFHAGFRADPGNELKFQGKAAAPYERAFSTFIESVGGINSYAEERNVRIAIENNVLAEYNMADGENPYLLLCKAEEFEAFFTGIASRNVGILLDLGHLNVTAKSLKFDRYDFIKQVKDRVSALHVHENNGLADEHKGIKETSWCLDIAGDFAGLPVVIESVKQSIEQIKRQVTLLENVPQG